MNFINKTLCITALFAIGSVAARQMNVRGAAPVKAPVAAKTRGSVQPTAPVQSYKQLHDAILTMKQGDAFTGNRLNETFVKRTLDQAKTADLGSDGLRFLLQTARDKFAPFTGNNDTDLNLLIQINGQIDTAVKNI